MPDEKVALQLRVANLYLEKFQNQAEAIKCFEAILEIDPANPEAITFLKQMYEKRRDWERLIAVLRQEVARIVDPSEQARAVGRGGQARHREAEEGRRLHRAVEQGPRARRTAMPRRSASWRSSTSARSTGRSWPQSCSKQVALTERAGQARRRCCPSWPSSTPRSCSKLDMAIAAWKALLDIEPDNRRAQDALRKLYLQSKDWDALEGFYSAQGKWDEFVRVLERQTESEDDATRVGLWNKIALALPGSPGQGRQGAEGLREDPVARFRQPARRRGADPDLREGQGRTQAGRGAASAAAPHHRSRRCARSACSASPSSSTPRRARSPRRSAVALQATSENPARGMGARGGPAPGRRDRRVGQLGRRCTRRRCRALARARQSCRLLATLARAYEKELANYPLAIERNKQVLALDAEQRAGGAGARAPLRRHRPARRAARHLRQEAEPGRQRRRKSATFASSSRLLYEEQIRDVDKALELYRDILKTDPDDLQALRALGRLYQATEKWEELADDPRTRSSPCAPTMRSPRPS